MWVLFVLFRWAVFDRNAFVVFSLFEEKNEVFFLGGRIDSSHAKTLKSQTSGALVSRGLEAKFVRDEER